MKPLRTNRQSAFERQNGRCYYCNLPMYIGDAEIFARQQSITVNQARLLKCTAEHLTARQDGGKDTVSNIVAACLNCNRQRHNRKAPPAPEHFKKYVGTRMGSTGWHGQWTKPLLVETRGQR